MYPTIPLTSPDFLQKRARAGHWHRRFFKLNDVHLVYAKTALGALDDDDAVAHADDGGAALARRPSPSP